MTINQSDGYARFNKLFARYKHDYLIQEGLCFYCRQLMALPNPSRSHHPLPPDRVTREHLLSKAQARRYKRKRANYYLNGDRSKPPPPKVQSRNAGKWCVAACNQCNQERGGDTNWQTFLLRKIEERWAPR